MFTGLVSDIGIVEDVHEYKDIKRLRIRSGYPVSQISDGASIMHSGVCLTVIDFGPVNQGAWFEVEAVPETLNRTGLGRLKTGSKVNLELSLKLGDELGGHLVFGHVDGQGEVHNLVEEGGSYRVTIRPPSDINKYFATKGSVAVDGVSLTVAAAKPNGDFEIVIIPHTWAVTTLHELQVGSKVNLEVDMLARYVARMIGADSPNGQVTG